jgi:hypothetical protein
MIGYILALFAGLAMGLLGGGGSILTVPILVYVFSVDTKVAVAMSLAIVGWTALMGMYSHFKLKNISFKVAFIFGGFALPGTYFGSYLSQFISGQIQLLIFSAIMIIAAAFMFNGKKEIEESSHSLNYPLIAISGVFVGIMTGLIGVGGGFLIVPALMFFTGIDMRKAVGTSLFIISFNSIFGFLSYLGRVEIPWNLMIIFSICSTVGIFIGAKLNTKVPQAKLKKIFAVFLIIMGIFILYKNL